MSFFQAFSLRERESASAQASKTCIIKQSNPIFCVEMLQAGVLVVLLLMEFAEINATWHEINCDDVTCYHPEAPQIPDNYKRITFCNYDLSLSGACAEGQEVYEVYVPKDRCTGENESWWRYVSSLICDCNKESKRDTNGICQLQTDTVPILNFINDISFHKLIETIKNSPASQLYGLYIGLLVLLLVGLYYFHKKIGGNFTKAMQNVQVVH